MANDARRLNRPRDDLVFQQNTEEDEERHHRWIS